MINGIPLLVLIAVGVTCLLGMALIVISEIVNRRYKTPAYFLWAVAFVLGFGGLFLEDVMTGAMFILIGAMFVVVSIPLRKAGNPK